MADQQQLDFLRQGVYAWNGWRRKHPRIYLDLSNADLSETDLSGVNLSGAYLKWANLRGTILIGADLREAYLMHANLMGAYLNYASLMEANLHRAGLRDADLSGTTLYRATLYRANLTGANLTGADLTGANLNGANLNGANLDRTNLDRTNFSEAVLSGANFNKARVAWTIFGYVDLRNAKGLESIVHQGPSIIGMDTISRSDGIIPEVFLRGTGLTNTFIEYAHSLVQNPIEYYTCFISYSSNDQDFAERIHTDLQANGVRCWYAPEDLKIGEKFWHRIDESIRLYDKLLVVLSEHSVNSEWVEREVMAALEKEQQHHKPALFPIKLDKKIMQTSLPWAADIRRTRHIGDFTHWKEHDAYQNGLRRLLRDLQPNNPPTSKF